MKFPFFASFIILCGLLSYRLKKAGKAAKNEEDAFWARESMANTARRKPLTDLAYISIPLEELLIPLFDDSPELKELKLQLIELSEKKIVNLNSFTNTDLKLAYGVANLQFLQEYDQNFTDLICLLQKIAEELYNIPSTDSSYSAAQHHAVKVLEYAVISGSDIYSTYELLVQLYTSMDEPDKIIALLPYAEKITSLSRKRILELLG